MDRRQQKTRKAIFGAFRSLLEKKRYDHITVQEIIDTADVGRSTFYAHFETKDSLLSGLCEDLFYHIFGHDPCPWNGLDNDLESKLAHTLWHIQEEKDNLSGILLSDSSALFMTYFKEQVRTLFEAHLSCFKVDVPKEFLLNHLTGSFAETVLWWMKENTVPSPEIIASYFIKMVQAK